MVDGSCSRVVIVIRNRDCNRGSRLEARSHNAYSDLGPRFWALGFGSQFPQHPGPRSQHPGPRSQHPRSRSQHPGPRSQHPGPSSQHPGPSSQHPGPRSQHPGPSSQHPRSRSQHPGPSSQVPGPNSHKLPHSPTRRFIGIIIKLILRAFCDFVVSIPSRGTIAMTITNYDYDDDYELRLR
jgi:hypothetical protein